MVVSRRLVSCLFIKIYTFKGTGMGVKELIWLEESVGQKCKPARRVLILWSGVSHSIDRKIRIVRVELVCRICGSKGITW